MGGTAGGGIQERSEKWGACLEDTRNSQEAGWELSEWENQRGDRPGQLGPEGHSKVIGFCLSELGGTWGSEARVEVGVGVKVRGGWEKGVSDLGLSVFILPASPGRLQGTQAEARRPAVDK